MLLFHGICLIFSYLPIARTSGETIKVLTTEEDLAKFSDGSGARLKDAPVVDLVDVTVCLRFYEFIRVKQKELINSKYEYDISSPIFALGDYADGNKWFGFLSRWTKLTKNLDWPIMTWNHICWSFDNETSIIRMVSNGDVAVAVSYTHLTLPTKA